ncbi:class I SAM-dependent DNA methyltransferase [Psychrobacter sp. I-STPA6b]|uniref:HsdM family class I SAM-dependent methyltransferase n=1 Tax=Psychrobacter sp. I-STPA6b TaxID=2585718 RepID=UPI001D0C4EB1|nr:DNA methyltransferase [Psychrobacter sp. I-STPA6b]
MKEIFDFLRVQTISEPSIVDSFIVTAFVRLNKISIVNNSLVLSYIIDESNSSYERYLNFEKAVKNALEEFTLEHLCQLFEFVISPSDRVISGAIYTPLHIREYIVQSVIKDKDVIHKTFADISCGCGGFLLVVANMLKQTNGLSFSDIYENYLFGVDIKNYSIERTKIVLSLNALFHNEDIKGYDFNLYIADALSFKWSEAINGFKGFDFIVGNPPYVSAKNLDESSKVFLKEWSVANLGNTDLYIPFFQIAISNLMEDGSMGYITMNSFFKSLNARLLRQYFQELKLDFSIVDFGYEQLFKSKNTYTCICIIRNSNKNYINYKSLKPEHLGKSTANLNFDKIYYNKLDFKSGWNLKNHDLIQKIESTGTPFGEIYTTRHGIATLKNDVYIFKPVTEDDKYYYFIDSTKQEVCIEKKICRDIYNTNKLSSIQDPKKLVEKVIFPYLNEENTVTLIDEDSLSSKFPKAYEYLVSKKDILSKRDKGKGIYPNWYAYGRSQSLANAKYKLFFPKYSNTNSFFIINDDEQTKFYNGQALIGKSIRDLKLAKVIMQSRIFWFYLSSTSKPYSSGYYSMNGNYIKHFGVYDFNEEDIKYLLTEQKQVLIDKFIETKYGISLSDQ